MSKGLRKIWSVITTLIVIAAVILALLFAGVRLIGLNVYVVLSGSMEPTYHTGSIIYVKKADPYELKTGDVITFMLDEDTFATHRIAGIVPDEDDPSAIRFRTKGDANEFDDGTLIHYKNVVGVPVFTIPKLGYLANYIQHPPGLYVTIAAAAFLMLLMFIPELVSAIKGEAEPKEEKPKKQKKAKPQSLEASPEHVSTPEAEPKRARHESPVNTESAVKPRGAHEAAHSASRRGGAHTRGCHEAR